MGPRDGRAFSATRRTSGGRAISSARSSEHVVPRACRRASRTAAARSGACPCATRRRAADAGDDARGGPMVRPGADRDPRQRRQPGRHRQGRTRPVRASRVPEPVAGSPREVLHAGWRSLDRRSRASAARRLRRREPGCAGRGGAPRVRADHLLPQRVHLLFRSEHPADARRDDATRCPTRRTSASARRNRCCACARRSTSQEIGGAFVYVKGKHAVKRSPSPVPAQQDKRP